MTEESLMAAYCRGDMEAFERLFSMLGPHVHGFFRRSFQSDVVADDLLQTTFLKLHQARDQYRHGEPLRPWLFAIAARVRIDEYRRTGRMQSNQEDAMAAGNGQGEVSDGQPGQAPSPCVENAELVERVREALSQLPESQRIIVHLHRYTGLTFPEIGQALGLSAGAVKLRAFRAYEQLRKRLRPLWAGNGP
jgi:RNA polymerase sigma-70 factor (ECF subfamily)